LRLCRWDDIWDEVGAIWDRMKKLADFESTPRVFTDMYQTQKISRGLISVTFGA